MSDTNKNELRRAVDWARELGNAATNVESCFPVVRDASEKQLLTTYREATQGQEALKDLRELLELFVLGDEQTSVDESALIRTVKNLSYKYRCREGGDER